MFIVDDVVKIAVNGVVSILSKILTVTSSSEVRKAHFRKRPTQGVRKGGGDHASH
ncbi:hypothetical protein MCBRY_001169 [Methylocystis bryophila]